MVFVFVLQWLHVFLMTILLVFGDVWCLLDPVASVLGVQGLNLT